ncbi:hypothetical protein [Methylomonas rosea]|uniref:Uncharacterized protein n=1 Tax=Methylomonas rosea TaxID=2952227 RepID=A0ABT1TZ77_9GAMM|nr:hypothetical protein [Methylomonas sp. WSC-7]MCQ8119903.1 hypothetical protein [Methylomonas sp. WSC-7]
MPVLIDEVILEVQDGVTEAAERQPTAQQTPLSPVEIELTQMLELIRQRQERLRID